MEDGAIFLGIVAVSVISMFVINALGGHATYTSCFVVSSMICTAIVSFGLANGTRD